MNNTIRAGISIRIDTLRREAEHSAPSSGLDISTHSRMVWGRIHDFREGSMSSINSSGPHFPIFRPAVDEEGIPTTREADGGEIPSSREAEASFRTRRDRLIEPPEIGTSVTPHLDRPTGRMEIFRGTLSASSSYQLLVDGAFGELETGNLVHQLKTAIAILEAQQNPR